LVGKLIGRTFALAFEKHDGCFEKLKWKIIDIIDRK